MKQTMMLVLLACLRVGTIHAQAPAAIQHMALTGQPVGKYVEGLLDMDRARLKLTPAQTIQARAVLTDYATKYNQLSQGPAPSMAKLKAGLVQLDAERIRRYKGFLTAEQYAQLVSSYNQSHPKTPVK